MSGAAAKALLQIFSGVILESYSGKIRNIENSKSGNDGVSSVAIVLLNSLRGFAMRDQRLLLDKSRYSLEDCHVIVASPNYSQLAALAKNKRRKSCLTENLIQFRQ